MTRVLNISGEWDGKEIVGHLNFSAGEFWLDISQNGRMVEINEGEFALAKFLQLLLDELGEEFLTELKK